MYARVHPRCIEDCVNEERKNVALYGRRSNKKLIIASTTELELKDFINVENRQERRKHRLIEWKEKALHGQFLSKTKNTDDGNRWEWQKQGGELKCETENVLCVAQE